MSTSYLFLSLKLTYEISSPPSLTFHSLQLNSNIPNSVALKPYFDAISTQPFALSLIFTIHASILIPTPIVLFSILALLSIALFL